MVLKKIISLIVLITAGIIIGIAIFQYYNSRDIRINEVIDGLDYDAIKSVELSHPKSSDIIRLSDDEREFFIETIKNLN